MDSFEEQLKEVQSLSTANAPTVVEIKPIDPYAAAQQAYIEVVKKLDSFGVPAINRTLWQRVESFAKNYDSWINLKQQGEKPVGDTPPAVTLSEDQLKAWTKLEDWFKRTTRFFVMKGYAGTGKTFLMKKLLERTDVNIKFSAPTNKAAKVLSQTLGIETKTIYSLLGLRMVAHEDGMYLDYPKELPRITKGTVIVIDEASMVGSDLNKFIKKAAIELGLRVIYVGDPAQLNPVKEKISPAWKMVEESRNKAMLRKVMRFDNQLLKLSMNIREAMKEGVHENIIKSDNDGSEGVFVIPYHRFEVELKKLRVEDFVNTKVIAWRNKTVNRYNKMLRQHFGFTQDIEKGELLLLGEPIEVDEKIVGHTDEEGVVLNVSKSHVTVDLDTKIPVWAVVFKTDVQVHRLNVPLGEDDLLQTILSKKASKAKNEKNKRNRARLWKDFWTTKRKFHSVRYAYALTAHRIQGSTCKSVFVDQEDIMANRDKSEALRCLYVACTRPQQKLYTF